jgi:hypothetical protein
LFAPINDDRRHLGAANRNGLRKRSAGASAEMLMSCGHWNVVQHAQSRERAKIFLIPAGEDWVTD